MVLRDQFDRQFSLLVVHEFFEAVALVPHRLAQKLAEALFTESQLGRADIPVDFDTHRSMPLR